MTQGGETTAPERTDLAARAARNSLYSLLGFVYPIALNIVITPLLIHRLGVEGFGIFSLATVFVGLIALLDVGVAPSLMKTVAVHAARGEEVEVNNAFGLSLIFYAAIGLIGAAVAVVVARFLITDIFNISATSRPVATFAFAVAGAGFLLTMLLSPLGAIPPALQRYDVATKVNVVITTVGAGGTAAVLLAGLGLRAVMVLTSIAIPLLALGAYAVIDRRIYRNLRFRLYWERDLAVQLGSFAGFAFISNTAGLVLFQFDKVLLGSLASVSAVTYYVVPGNLAQRVHSASANLASVVFPAASDLFAREDMAAVRRLYVRATRFVVLFIVSTSIPALVFADKLLRYWIGPGFADHGTTVLRILLVTYSIMALNVVPYYVTLGAGRPRIAALFNIVTALINVVLVIVLIPRFGATGAAVAYLISVVPFVGFIWYAEARLLAVSEAFWLRLVTRLLIPIAAQIGVCLALRPLIHGLLSVLCAILIVLPIPALVGLLVGLFDDDDRVLLRRLVPVALPDWARR